MSRFSVFMYINSERRTLLVYSYLSFIMDRLGAVENILGDVECSPSSIIFDLFITKPCNVCVIRVSAFMYGNNVPVEKAVDCFVACVGSDSYYASCVVKDLYTTWDNFPSKTHFALYFSMTSKRKMWLNGKSAAQIEAVWPKGNVVDAIVAIGTENAGCPLHINSTIRNIHSSTSVV